MPHIETETADNGFKAILSVATTAHNGVDMTNNVANMTRIDEETRRFSKRFELVALQENKKTTKKP